MSFSDYTSSSRELTGPLMLEEGRPQVDRHFTSKSEKRRSAYVRFGGKRILDVCVAVGALVFLAPVLVLISIFVAVQGGLPVLFRHERIGQGRAPFMCLKFRSMVKDADAQLQQLLETCPESRREWDQTHKLLKDPRVHWIGRILRKSSLDELPQLINILRGEMSLVGPRPIVEAEIARYGDAFESYQSVKPGLTGLWQVSGRSDTGYRERVSLDTYYTKNVTLRGDLEILVKTVWVVFIGRGSC